MCRGEMKSSLGVVKLGILRLRLSRGLDARGCRLLQRHSVMPWWQRGSYATTVSSFKLHLKTLEVCSVLVCLDEGHFKSAIVSSQYRHRLRLMSIQPLYQLCLLLLVGQLIWLTLLCSLGAGLVDLAGNGSARMAAWTFLYSSSMSSGLIPPLDELAEVGVVLLQLVFHHGLHVRSNVATVDVLPMDLSIELFIFLVKSCKPLIAVVVLNFMGFDLMPWRLVSSNSSK